jgi:hypothetical protein
VRTALPDIDADVRLAAIAALGVNGDAADVPVLLGPGLGGGSTRPGRPASVRCAR